MVVVVVVVAGLVAGGWLVAGLVAGGWAGWLVAGGWLVRVEAFGFDIHMHTSIRRCFQFLRSIGPNLGQHTSTNMF